MKKKFTLLLAFLTFHFFFPIIYTNCSGVDLPYVAENEPVFSDNDKLEMCLELDVLIADCVDVLQEYEETLKTQEALVNNAADSISSFETCQTEESIDSTLIKYETDESVASTETEETTESTVDCSSIIYNMITAYQTCSTLPAADKFTDCYDVENTIESAATACESGADEISIDFCNSLTA